MQRFHSQGIDSYKWKLNIYITHPRQSNSFQQCEMKNACQVSYHKAHVSCVMNSENNFLHLSIIIVHYESIHVDWAFCWHDVCDITRLWHVIMCSVIQARRWKEFVMTTAEGHEVFMLGFSCNDTVIFI